VKELLDDLLREAGIHTEGDTRTPVVEIVEIDDNTPCDIQPVAQFGHIPLYPGEMVVLSGMPGSGKSTFLMTHAPEGALILETDFVAPIAAWLRKRLNIRTRFRFAYVTHPAGLISVLQSVEENKNALNAPAIIIDTIQGVTSDPETLDAIVQYVREFATRTGIPVIVASHENRRDASPMERIQGSLRLPQESTLILRVVGNQRGTRRVHVLKNRYALMRDLPASWEWNLDAHTSPPSPSGSTTPPNQQGHPTPPTKPTPVGGVDVLLSPARHSVEPTEPTARCTEEAFALLQKRGPMSAADIARALGYSRAYAQKLLQRLMAAGKVQITRPGRRGRGHATLYMAKMPLSHGYVIPEESTPQESASDLEKVPELHFMSASEADSQPKMQLGSENATGAELHFTAYGHADLRPKMPLAGIYKNARVPETGTRIKGQIDSQGVGVSQDENETRNARPREDSVQHTVEPTVQPSVEPPNGSTGDRHACPSKPTDTGQSQPTPPPTALTQEIEAQKTESTSLHETRVACPPSADDDDFPIWAIWTIEMPHTRKDGACPFRDCPYHKTPREKNPDSWSWLL
jgi:biotin operon repressor